MSETADLFTQAQRLHQEGRLADAEALYRRIVEIDPSHADARHYLGVLDMQAGRLEDAERSIRAAIALKPTEAVAHANLGRALRQRRRFTDAEAAFRTATQLDPRRATAWAGLSEALSLQGKQADALEAAETALARDGALAQGHYFRAVALHKLGRWAEAESAYREAIVRDDVLGEAYNDLALLLIELRRGDDAHAVLDTGIAKAPKLAALHNTLGTALHAAGRIAAAVTAFGRAIDLDPTFVAARVNGGAALRDFGRLQQAAEVLQAAVTLEPRNADAHGNLALVLRDLGRFDGARPESLRAVELAPDRPDFLTTLAFIESDCGRSAEALDAAQRAVTLDLTRLASWRALLGVMLYHPGLDDAQRWRYATGFGAVAQRAATPAAPANARSAGRPLRVGYVSSDLRATHPIVRNLGPVLRHRDRGGFHTTMYADVAPAVAEPLRPLADAWRFTSGYSDERLAALIREDAIDILVLLGGRFDRNRPQIAAWRAAPMQISFHDPATSGVPGMDVLIADDVLVPREGTERFVERIARLSCFYVHDPIDAPTPVRARETGGVTFGCFNNPAKLSEPCLRLWGRILASEPNARLILKFRTWFSRAAVRDRVVAALESGGASSGQIEFVADQTETDEHLAIYNRIDIALDPFPFTGSTTTFEALWMGVPVVTLLGDHMAARWSASMLCAAGLDDYVARSGEEYVALALRLARDLPALAKLRAELRGRVAASPLCDGAGRARELEEIYRAAWAGKI